MKEFGKTNSDSIQRSSDEQSPDEFSIVELMSALYAQKTTVVRGTLITGVLFAILAFALHPQYTATATFIPPNSNVSGSSTLAGQLAQFSSLGSLIGSKSNGDLYVGMLQSRTISDKMISRFGLMSVYHVKELSSAERLLSAHSDFIVGTKDPIVSVIVTDHDPVRARDIANGYLQELQHVSEDLALSESSQRRLFFERRLNQEKGALADAEVALKTSQEQSGLIAPAGQTSTQIQAIAELRSEIAVRQVRLASLLQDETEQNVDVIRVRNEIRNLESQVSQMNSGRSGGPSGAISNAQVPGLSLDYIRRTRDVKYHETLFDIISKQYEVARLDEAHDAPLQVLDQANVPDSRSGPPRLLIVVGGFLLGLFGSSLFVVLRDNLQLRRKTSGPILEAAGREAAHVTQAKPD